MPVKRVFKVTPTVHDHVLTSPLEDVRKYDSSEDGIEQQ